MPVLATKGYASCLLYEKNWRGGVGNATGWWIMS
jgi:hypothetical protein